MFKKFFLSGPHNDHHPHLLRPKTLALFSLVAALIFAGSIFNRFLLTNSDLLASVYSKALISLANENRKEGDVAVLTENEVLTRAAQLKADDMASRGYFAHESPDGITPWYWLKEAGYVYQYAGENLAVNFDDSIAVDKAWMNSPTHRANILNQHFTEIGIAQATGMYKGKETVFVVQMFGAPKNVPVALSTKTPVSKPATPKTLAKKVAETVASSSVLGESIVESSFVATAYAEDVTEKVATNPGRVLNISYLILGLLVFFALIFLFFTRIHKHHVSMGLHATFFIILLLVSAVFYHLII